MTMMMVVSHPMAENIPHPTTGRRKKDDNESVGDIVFAFVFLGILLAMAFLTGWILAGWFG